MQPTVQANAFFSETDVRRSLDPVRLLDAVERAFRERYPRVTIPARTQLELADGIFLVMACFDPVENALGMKLITVRKNPGPGKERVNATYFLLDPQTAQPRLTIAANFLTDARTAAASAIATKFLARPDCSTLGIFGTGRLARAHLQFLPLVRKFERALICGRDSAGSARFIADLPMAQNLPVQAADPRTCAAESDVICTCTTSDTPLFDGSVLRPGAHLNLTGAFRPNAREVDTTTVRRARVFVDTHEGADTEAGDLLMPIREGSIAREHIIGDLYELLSGKKPGRTKREEITLFKSVGCALEDLVAGENLLSTRA
ncbi:MAG TPA: ornithine cyclodeaminase family protein [Candidatus Sulfotelmatobacter sp.]|nr:ornithine cyclodeaminase family protein [Candidatus Sulfotelmatobacter sp.]